MATLQHDLPPPAALEPPEGCGPPTNRTGSFDRRRLARLRRDPQLAARGGLAAFWALLAALIVLPCACFLMLAVSPRPFGQGSQWFTLSYLRGVFTGTTAVSLVDSLWVSAAAAGIGLLVGIPIAWLANRTLLPGRRFIAGAMWLVLLLPSWLPASGWERLVQPDGVMYRIGLDFPFITSAIMGPFGVVLLLGLRCVPFTYLTITAALRGLGQEYEDAARTHGAGRMASLRLLIPILAPAITSAIAIGFAESVSDFGVAATLAYRANFPLATYQLFANVNGFPPSFPGAAAIGWLLVGSVAVPLALQARALRGRAYRVLSGRSRPALRRRLSPMGLGASLILVIGYFSVALGVPGFGALSSSLLSDYGASLQPTLVNYRAVFENSGLSGPLGRSLIYGLITATVTVALGFLCANLLSRRGSASGALLDFLLLAAVALPGVVFGAGYIFAYNLPALSHLGLSLYQTTTLLVVAYIASSMPTNARVLVGAVSQIDPSLRNAARAHGASATRAWARGVLPALSRPLLMAWLLTFSGILLELPLSQLLYAPGSPPASVAIEDNLGNYHFGIGTAQAVVAVGLAFAVVGLALGIFRLVAPDGWRHVGEGVNE